MKLRITILLILTSFLTMQAQFGRLADKIGNRISNRLEDKLADAIANEIYKKAFKSVDQSIDEAMRKSFEDSLGTKNVDYSKMGKAYGEFLRGFNEAYTNLPPQYNFDIVTEVTINDGKKINLLKMLYTKDGSIVGYQTEEKGKLSTIVFDLKTSVMVMYSEEKGKKSGQILPSITGLAKLYGTEATQEITIKKTGGSKTVLGYKCDEYESIYKDYYSKYYVTPKFMITYNQAYRDFFKQFTPAATYDKDGAWEGFVLRSETYSKDKKSESIYEVVKAYEQKTTFTKADYTFPQP
jgi:hypothetical protein